MKVMQDSEVNSSVFFFRTIGSVKVFVNFSSPKGGEKMVADELCNRPRWIE